MSAGFLVLFIQMISYFIKNFIELQQGFSYVLIVIVSTLAIALTFFDDRIFLFEDKIENPKKKLACNIGLVIANYIILLFLAIFFLWAIDSMFMLYSISLYFTNYLVYLLVICVELAIFHKRNITAFLIEAMVLWLSIIVVGTICSLLSHSITLENNSSLFQFIASFFYIFFMALVLFMLRKTELSKFNKSDPTYVIAILFATFFSLFATLFINPSLSNTNESQTKYFVMYIGIELMILILYLLYFFTLKEKQKAFISGSILYKIQTEGLMQEQAEENYQQLLTLKNYVNDQYSNIENLIESNNMKELKKYFSDLFENKLVPLNFIDCGNLTISTIMNIEQSKCVKQEIVMVHELIVPSKLDFIDYDLCSLFTNLIDNAIEATSNLKRKEKEIKVNIRYSDPYLIASIENPTDLMTDQIDKAITHTKKKEKEFHGYGHKIIEEITKKYNGTIKYKIEGGKFIASVMLMKKENPYA